MKFRINKITLMKFKINKITPVKFIKIDVVKHNEKNKISFIRTGPNHIYNTMNGYLYHTSIKKISKLI